LILVGSVAAFAAPARIVCGMLMPVAIPSVDVIFVQAGNGPQAIWQDGEHGQAANGLVEPPQKAQPARALERFEIGAPAPRRGDILQDRLQEITSAGTRSQRPGCPSHKPSEIVDYGTLALAVAAVQRGDERKEKGAGKAPVKPINAQKRHF